VVITEKSEKPEKHLADDKVLIQRDILLITACGNEHDTAGEKDMNETALMTLV